jgi:hypothetical protein
MKAVARAVDRAAEVRADRGKATVRVAFAQNENALVIQESHRAIEEIIRLASLEALIRFKKDIGHQKPHGAGRGGRDGKDGRQPTEDQLDETAS